MSKVLLKSLSGIRRQTEHETCWSTLYRNKANVATVLTGQTPGRRQSETAAAAGDTTRIKWIEHELSLRWIWPWTAVFNHHVHLIRFRHLQANTGPTIDPSGFNRVANKTLQGGPYLIGVRVQADAMLQVGAEQPNPAFDCQLVQRHGDLADQTQDVDHLLAWLRRPSKLP